MCDAPDIAGSDPFGLGATLFVDFFASTTVIGLDAHSDVSGVATFGAPLPNDPFLVGAQYFAQALFVETPGERCSASQFGLVTSTAMSITVLP